MAKRNVKIRQKDGIWLIELYLLVVQGRCETEQSMRRIFNSYSSGRGSMKETNAVAFLTYEDVMA